MPVTSKTLPVAGHAWALGALAALVDTARNTARSAVHIDVWTGDDDEPLLALRDDGPGLSMLGVQLRLGATARPCAEEESEARGPGVRGPASCSPAIPTRDVGFAGTPWLGAVFRLGRDVCALSKRREGCGKGAVSRVIALLSRTGAVDGTLSSILAVDWDDAEARAASVSLLATYSPWASEESIDAAFDTVGDTGVLIAVFNLRRTVEEAVLELDVESDDADILLDPTDEDAAPVASVADRAPQQPLTVHMSMRAYLQVLYLESSATDLRPGMDRGPRIYLRGKIIRELRVGASLLLPRDYVYMPRGAPEEVARYRLGVNAAFAGAPVGVDASFVPRPGADDAEAHATMACDHDWGMLVYCGGRLIWPYVRFAAHESAEHPGGNAALKRRRVFKPIVGVVEVDAWTASPNAQSFTGNELLKRTKQTIERNLGAYIAKYWSLHSEPASAEDGRAPDTWVRCDECDAWRIVANPTTRNMSDVHLVPRWVCSMNVGGTRGCNGRDDPVRHVPSSRRVRGPTISHAAASGDAAARGEAAWPAKRDRPSSARAAPRKRRRAGGLDPPSPSPSGEAHVTSTSHVDSVTIAAAAAHAAAVAAGYCTNMGNYEMDLPPGVGALPPSGTVGSDGEFLPELDLNARTPEPHELPITGDIAGDDFVLVNGLGGRGGGDCNDEELAARREELDRLEVDGADASRRADAAAGLLTAALGASKGLDRSGAAASPPPVGTASSAATASGPAAPLQGRSEPVSAQNEAAVALVAMNRSSDGGDRWEASPLTATGLNGADHAPQTESDEVRDAIAAVEERANARQRPGDAPNASTLGGPSVDDGAAGRADGGADGERDGGSPTKSVGVAIRDVGVEPIAPAGAATAGGAGAVLNGGAGPGLADLLDGAPPLGLHHLDETLDDGNDVGDERRTCGGGRMNGSGEHLSEGSKGPSRRERSPARNGGVAGSGDDRGDGAAGAPADAATDDGGGRTRGGGDGGGSGSGSGQGGDGRWRAKFLQLAALLEGERSSPRGPLPPLQSVGLSEADDVVDELKRQLAGISREAVDARAEQMLACEQLDGVRRLIRVFLERGVGIVRPEDDEDEPIESHFSAYLRMIDVLHGNAELS